MSGIASIEIEQRELVWGESARGTVTLANEGDETLSYLNSANRGSMPTFVLTDVKTGESREFFDLKLPDSGEPASEVEVDAVWSRDFDLQSTVDLPAPGTYELRARFKWSGGGTLSEPVGITVTAADPVGFAMETGSGGPFGDLFCAWTNRIDATAEIWLWQVETIFDTKIKRSRRILEVPTTIRPILSVPGNTASTGKYIGWLDGSELKIVEIESAGAAISVTLDAPDYSIVPPLMEPRSGADDSSVCEVLLAKPAGESWRIGVVAAEGGSALKLTELPGPFPVAFRTAYGSDGVRRTTFLQAMKSDGESVVRLSCVDWPRGSGSFVKRAISEWPAVFIAFDQAILEDDSVAGAVITAPEEGNQFDIRSWRIATNGEFRWGPSHRIKGKFSNGVVRTTPEGSVIALFQNEANGVWWMFDSVLGLRELPDILQGMSEPLGLFFVDRRIPAVMFNDPGCGLRIAYPAQKPRRISLTGGIT